MLDVTLINIPGGTKGELQQCCLAKWEGKNHQLFSSSARGWQKSLKWSPLPDFKLGRRKREKEMDDHGECGQWSVLGQQKMMNHWGT